MIHRSGTGWASLKSSPLELFYFVWLLAHAYVAIFIDCQALYPSWILQFFPQFLLELPKTWDEIAGDPLVRSLTAEGAGRVNEFTWFWALTLTNEALVEIPTAIIGAVGLWKNYRANWIIVFIYGLVTSFSLIPCIATIWFAPAPGMTSDLTMVTLSDTQKKIIIGSYSPYFLVPFLMAVDSGRRIWNFIAISEQVQAKAVKVE
ncbi:hypothetical protein DL93DRAFT_2164840 [Clavulina sp. PMI_390]|nr:hypothetical protein DL93DRAFT_2164840 [Clavulina sp. PMI_390]